ncbi:MAG TPA: amino acid ABC transporter substrate-binding protein [Polyangiales bacterium]|nr:amino acid ABC transporter substrate-binding protein [Polyangiales bacterium]
MTIRTLILGCSAVLVLLLAGGCKSKGDAVPEPTPENTAADKTAPAPDPTLVLGASLALTGSLAREGGLTKEGYELCVKVVNDKGGVPVGDKKLKLEVRVQDDTSKPDTAAQLVDQFNDQGVKLILGPYGSATTEAAAAVIERNGQVMADTAGADDKIFQKGYTRTFAVLAPATQYLASMVQAVAELAEPKPKTIAIISADDGFSKTATKGGLAKAQELGLQVAAEEYVPNAASDVSSALTKIKPKKPDVIFGSAHVVESIAMVRQSGELGVKPLGFGATVAPHTPDFRQTLGAAADGVLGSTQWTPKTAGSDKWFGSATDYAATFGAMFGGREPAYQNAQATAGCLALILAAEKAGSLEPNAVKEQMVKMDEKTFFGPIKFNEKGQNVAKFMSVIQIQDGRPVLVWPKDSAEAPLRWPGTGGKQAAPTKPAKATKG